MTAEEFRNTIKNESYIGGGSPLHLEFHAFSQRAMKLTPTVNKHIFSDVDINSTVRIKWWKNSKCFINF